MHGYICVCVCVCVCVCFCVDSESIHWFIDARYSAGTYGGDVPFQGGYWFMHKFTRKHTFTHIETQTRTHDANTHV